MIAIKFGSKKSPVQSQILIHNNACVSGFVDTAFS